MAQTSVHSHKQKFVSALDAEVDRSPRCARIGVSPASIAKLIIVDKTHIILFYEDMLESDTAVAWAHNAGLDSSYTLNIEHYGGAGGHCLRYEIIIEVNSHAGRRQIHNLAHVIPAPHYRAAERGDGMA